MTDYARLFGMRCYLCGAMDRADDFGQGWRERLTVFLEKFGIIVLNPCNKPTSHGQECVNNIISRKEFKKSGDYSVLADVMHDVRTVDLRMVDIADFLIVYLDVNVHACGTYEEIAWANRMKMPVLICCEQGRGEIPDWLYGMLPVENMFDKWDDLKKYLWEIHASTSVATLNRWVFFDYSRMIPKVSYEESLNLKREMIFDVA